MPPKIEAQWMAIERRWRKWCYSIPSLLPDMCFLLALLREIGELGTLQE